jgi:hypothetical protein
VIKGSNEVIGFFLLPWLLFVQLLELLMLIVLVMMLHQLLRFLYLQQVLSLFLKLLHDDQQMFHHHVQNLMYQQ